MIVGIYPDAKSVGGWGIGTTSGNSIIWQCNIGLTVIIATDIHTGITTVCYCITTNRKISDCRGVTIDKHAIIFAAVYCVVCNCTADGAARFIGVEINAMISYWGDGVVAERCSYFCSTAWIHMNTSGSNITNIAVGDTYSCFCINAGGGHIDTDIAVTCVAPVHCESGCGITICKTDAVPVTKHRSAGWWGEGDRLCLCANGRERTVYNQLDSVGIWSICLIIAQGSGFYCCSWRKGKSDACWNRHITGQHNSVRPCFIFA